MNENEKLNERRVERSVRRNRSATSRPFRPVTPLQVQRQNAEPQAEEPSVQVPNVNSVEEHRVENIIAHNRDPVFQPFRPVLPRHPQQGEPSARHPVIRPCQRNEAQNDASALIPPNLPQMLQRIREILARFPVHANEEGEVSAPTSQNQPAAFQPFRRLDSIDEEQGEVNVSISRERIEQPEPNNFIADNEDTRMSFTNDNPTCLMSIAESNNSTSWQQNFGQMDIDSTTSNSSVGNVQPMDVDSKDIDASSDEDCPNKSPIPAKRFKLSENEEKRNDDEPQPSTSKQTDFKVSEKSDFKLPPEPAKKRKTKRPKKTSGESEEAGKQSKFTIKTGFNETFCPDKDLRDFIIAKIKLISRMFILLTIFVNFALRHPKKDDLRNLWSLNGPDYLTITYLFFKNLGKTNKEEILAVLNREFVPEFTEYMGGTFEKFDCVNLSSVIQEMASQLNVNFRTNLAEHARSRLAQFFKFELSKNEKSKKQDASFEDRRKKREEKRQRNKEKRSQRNKMKRAKRKEHKKKKKVIGKQVRQNRHLALLETIPDKEKRDREIFKQVRNADKNNRILKRKEYYDVTTTTRRNRGDINKKSELQTKSKKSSSRCNNDNDGDETEEKELKKDEKYKLIKKLVDDLVISNECANETLKNINEESLDFTDIVQHNQSHKFLKFFHRLQLHFATNKCKSFNLVPVMCPGLKYITLTNTGLFEFERELKKTKGSNSIVSEPQATVKPGGLSPTELRKKIATEEKDYKSQVEPLKVKLHPLSEKKKNLNKEIKALKRKKTGDEMKQELTKLETDLKKVNKKLKPISDEMEKVVKAHKKIVAKRHENKYIGNDKRWARLFNFSHLRINKKEMKFSGTIMTDGVGVSVLFNLNNPKEKVDFSVQKNPIIDKKLENFNVLKGLDPGLKLAFGGIERQVDSPDFDIDTIDKHIKIKSASFRWITGQNRRREVLHKVYKSSEEEDPRTYFQKLLETEEYKEKVNNKDPRHIITTTKFYLKSFSRNQPLLEERKVAALKWDKYMCVRRETDLLANYLVGDKNKKQLIVVGQPNIPAWLKGHVRMSLSAVVKRLIEKQRKSENLHVVFVNEHRTTVMCSKCNVRVKIFRNRTTYCSNCETRWNRDVNAGRNILHLGLVKTGLIPKERLPHWEMFNALKAAED